jgi:hypothetical protein
MADDKVEYPTTIRFQNRWQEVDRFATNHKKQIGKLEIHFATIACWAGKCYGNEVSVPVHRMSACAPVGCLPNKN